jgi:hypothetical protein
MRNPELHDDEELTKRTRSEAGASHGVELKGHGWQRHLRL